MRFSLFFILLPCLRESSLFIHSVILAITYVVKERGGGGEGNQEGCRRFEERGEEREMGEGHISPSVLPCEPQGQSCRSMVLNHWFLDHQ